MSPEIPVVVDVKPNELVIVPASLELITTDGVVSFDGVLTTVSSISVGAVSSTSVIENVTVVTSLVFGIASLAVTVKL